MIVRHLSCGTMCPIGALLINGAGGLFEPAKLVCHCLLIEGPEGLILVDTGLGLADLEDPAKEVGKLSATLFRIERDLSRSAIHQVRAMGFNPTDVRDIVMTHLDFDHAGGMPDFPWARIHVLASEHEVAVNPLTMMEQQRYAQSHFAHHPDWRLHSIPLGEKWFGFENVQPLGPSAPDILLIPLPGHTRGHCGVAVQLSTGWLLHCGDAIFHRDELDPVEPSAPMGIHFLESTMKDDMEAMISNQSLLRQLYHENRDSIRFICSHDPVMFEASLMEGRAQLI